MRITLDIQAAVTQQAGIGRYTRMLAQHLPPLVAARGDQMRLVNFDFRRDALPIETQGAERRIIHWCPGSVMQQCWKRLHWPPYDAIAGAADLFHFPNFTMPPLRKGKAVVSVHDVSFLHYPEFAEARNLAYLKRHLPRTLDRADAIITISHNSKREIHELLEVDEARIHVTHLGISGDFAPASDAAQADMRGTLGLEQPYLLTVGTVEPRKNHRLLLEAFERLDTFGGDLVIAGGRGWKSGPFFERLEASPCRDRVRYIEYVPEGALVPLLTAARLFVTPSFYEGFGFTPLEALACGTPVVSSTGGSLPEVLGSAATLVEGFDADVWAAALAQSLECEPDRTTRETGRCHAAAFTWERTLEQTMDVYGEVLQ